jgi:hypothetical protein
MRSAKLMSLALCAAAAAGIAATAVTPRALAAGDPAAKAEAIAVFQKLNAQPSYRVKLTSSEGTGLIEVVQPDKMHLLGHGAQGSVEIFEIGTQTRIHIDMPGQPNGWRCTTHREITTYFDINKMRRDTTDQVVRLPDTVIDGTTVHGYTDSDTRDELYVDAGTGLPRRVVEIDNKGEKSTADFYDYGAPIAITPPPCG